MKKKDIINIKKTKETNKPIIVVSTKTSRKAVERNKIKRRIREIIKKYPPKTFQGRKIIIGPEALNLSYQELKEELKKETSIN